MRSRASFLVLLAQSAAARHVVLSNVVLPLDQDNHSLITGEASVLALGGFWYFYFNDWGSCPGVDCCDSAGGCASCCFDNPPHPMQPCSDPYLQDHRVLAYRTKDLATWEYLGVALPVSARPAGIVFRPCVVYNAKTGRFVMWFEDRGGGNSSSYYQVATANSPEGPFTVLPGGSGPMPGAGKIGDYSLFIDDDATAYHIRYGFDLVRLNDEYTGAAGLVATLTTPKRSEGPTMFKRQGRYYITAGTVCCACLGGSSVYVLTATKPEGPWTYLGDVGSSPTRPYDPHSPLNYVTRSQGTAVFRVENEFVYLGNVWNSGLARTPPGPRHHDLLYWGKLEFEAGAGRILQMEWHENITLELSDGVA